MQSTMLAALRSAVFVIVYNLTKHRHKNLDAQIKSQATKESKNGQTSKCTECTEERDLDGLGVGMVVLAS